PYESTLGVAPGAEILDVHVADGKHGGRAREVGADIGPDLGPTIKSGPEESEEILVHLCMLEGHVRANDRNLFHHPALVRAGRGDDVGGGDGRLSRRYRGPEA